ncbi:Hypothetical predicted protein [Octopus vulgaris]|uniref:Uncharacterized protein n=1 Tax=Octopus vulgaris TaxID=6645 RepID=A0AA36FKR8_OCTVU|nr:Hypothetical predicted protein [Octopus vulgaris]
MSGKGLVTTDAEYSSNLSRKIITLEAKLQVLSRLPAGERQTRLVVNKEAIIAAADAAAVVVVVASCFSNMSLFVLRSKN